MNREQKEKVVADLAALLDGSEAIIFTDFKGLKVDQMSVLRRKIAEAGGRYRVTKNTLLKVAAKGTAVHEITENMVGNNALGSTAGDPVSLAKAIMDFAKENERLIVKGGVVSGKVMDLNQIKTLSALPGRDILLARFLGALNALPTGLVRALSGLIQNLAYVLAAIQEQKEQSA